MNQLEDKNIVKSLLEKALGLLGEEVVDTFLDPEKLQVGMKIKHYFWSEWDTEKNRKTKGHWSPCNGYFLIRDIVGDKIYYSQGSDDGNLTTQIWIFHRDEFKDHYKIIP